MNPSESPHGCLSSRAPSRGNRSSLIRFASLIPKVSIADGDSISQTVLSWLLIVLSVMLAVLALVQCVCEVR